VFHLYVVQVERRAELQAFLRERGIETAIHYPTPLPFLDAYRARGFSREAFPRAAANQARILSLPMYAELEPEMIDHVVASIREFYRA
jgi:dTDP-4-amino-4,6-dideoxygalactose transaminase